MTDEQALLTAILANRADDTPRLAFADYLENDASPPQPERGEFIRVQCELARWGGCDWKSKHIYSGYVTCDQWNDLIGEGRVMTWCPDCVRRNELRRRERELLEANGLVWCEQSGVTECHINGPFTSCALGFILGQFYRGFVSHIACSWSDWRTHAAAILARQPIERVKLTDYPFQQANVVPGRTRDELELELLRLRWPAIEFELPPVEPVTFQEAVERQVLAVAERLGIPAHLATGAPTLHGYPIVYTADHL